MTWSRCWCCPRFLRLWDSPPASPRGMGECQGWKGSPTLPILKTGRRSQSRECLSSEHLSCQWLPDTPSNPVSHRPPGFTSSLSPVFRSHTCPQPFFLFGKFPLPHPSPHSALCVPPTGAQCCTQGSWECKQKNPPRL